MKGIFLADGEGIPNIFQTTDNFISSPTQEVNWAKENTITAIEVLCYTVKATGCDQIGPKMLDAMNRIGILRLTCVWRFGRAPKATLTTKTFPSLASLERCKSKP